VSQRFTIIDGYNVLHMNGFIGSRVGPGSLQKARQLFLGILARQMDPELRRRTTIVFDSREQGLPNRQTVHEMLVEFAEDHETADELICLLVRQHSAPKQLTVVSSDRQIQQVARARGATVVDSDRWLDSQAGEARASTQTGAADAGKPAGGLDPVAIEYWKRELALQEFAASDMAPDAEPPPGRETTEDAERLPREDDIFPPGYADDLFADDN
jgi:predicted RNA-binding protein with PIN domain